MVVLNYNLSTWETEARRYRVQGYPWPYETLVKRLGAYTESREEKNCAYRGHSDNTLKITKLPISSELILPVISCIPIKND